jgi:hypothetical protein
MSGAALQLHLKKAVLGMDIALGEEQIPFVFSKDLGHPETVPQDFDGFLKARKPCCAFELRQRPAQKTPEERRHYTS